MEELTDYENPQLDGNEEWIEPEENGNFKTILYAATAIVAIAGVYVAWLYLSSDKSWGYEITWKFWESSVLWPILSFIGFFLQFFNWQHASFREGWIVKDMWGNKKFVENNDIMSFFWGSCLFPLLAHFLIIPCIIGAFLYYLVIIPLALVNAIIPYLAVILSIGIAGLFYFIAKNFEFKNYSYVWLVVTAVISLLFIFLISLPTNENFSFGSSSPDNTEVVAPTAIGHATVTANVANLRTGPGTDYDFYMLSEGTKLQVTKGDNVEILEDTGDWFKILTSDGGTAYIKKTLCTDMELYLFDEDTAAECNEEEEMVAAEEEIVDDEQTDYDEMLSTEDVNESNSETENSPSIYVEQPATDEDVRDIVEQMPSFPGGNTALMQYLSNNVIYPKFAEEEGIQGRVVCTFVVEKDGMISNVKVVRSVDPSLDKEAVRVIKNMPKWIPGKQDGVPARVKYTVPVTFKLQ